MAQSLPSQFFPGPVVLVILDGWGIGRAEPGNAILAANTPTMDHLLASYPNATLRCSGEAVGLPPGQMGNSEVGHLNIGAGFVVYQWISRIDLAIADGTLARSPTLTSALNTVRRSAGTLHLLGLVSDGGVHSHVRHLDALLRIANDAGVARVAVHAFTDGRDTLPTSGLASIRSIESALHNLGRGKIASVSGRYFAMDRDNRWDRTERAFNVIAPGDDPRSSSASDVMAASYAAGVTDEFVPPTVIAEPNDVPTRIDAGDAIIAFNFRSDRMRQITAALTERDFGRFDRHGWAPVQPVLTMTRYDADLPTEVIFPPHDVEVPLSRVVSEAGLAQFHCAETEKYAHVTYFLNGGREEPFPGEERALVPSPKVATYDLQPEMSAEGVTDQVVDAARSGEPRFVVVNFANCDMVGHTGDFAATVRAVETVDRCLARVLEATVASRGIAVVTADHGNAEEMIDRATGGPMTSHTTNPVPVILVTPDDHPLRSAVLRQDAVLSGIAPTINRLLGLPLPASMTSPPLI